MGKEREVAKEFIEEDTTKKEEEIRDIEEIESNSVEVEEDIIKENEPIEDSSKDTTQEDSLDYDNGSSKELVLVDTKPIESLPTNERQVQLQKEIDTARAIVKKADQEVKDMISSIQKDIDNFEQYEDTKLKPIIKESYRILRRLDVESSYNESNPQIDLRDVEGEALVIKNLPTGKGSGWIWGLFASILTVVGWYIYGALSLGLPLIPKQIKDFSFLKPIANKLSLFIDQAPNSATGEGIAILSAIVIGWIVYMIVRNIRISKNQHIVEDIIKRATQYFQKKEEQKKSLLQVDEHIKALKVMLENSEVILDEKNAGLRRAIFIEKVDIAQNLHPKSYKNLEILQDILDSINKNLSTPISINGRLTQDSIESFGEFKNIIDKEIDRLYN